MGGKNCYVAYAKQDLITDWKVRALRDRPECRPWAYNSNSPRLKKLEAGGTLFIVGGSVRIYAGEERDIEIDFPPTLLARMAIDHVEELREEELGDFPYNRKFIALAKESESAFLPANDVSDALSAAMPLSDPPADREERVSWWNREARGFRQPRRVADEDPLSRHADEVEARAEASARRPLR